MHRYNLRVSIFIISLFIFTAPFNAEQMEKDALEQAFQTLPTLDWGGNSALLEQLDGEVLHALNDPAYKIKLETYFIQVLERPEITDAAADYICRKLSVIGTKAAVPALGKRLLNPSQSHMARFALRHIDAPEADTVLREALSKTDGDVKIGIIHTLGERQDVLAIDALNQLLQSNEPAIVNAALDALSKMRTPKAAQILSDYKSHASEATLLNAENACLAIAKGLQASGSVDEALKLYQELYENGTYNHVRMGAFQGLIDLNPGDRPRLLTEALNGQDRQMIYVAARMVVNLKGLDRKPFVKSLGKYQATAQMALITAFASVRETSARKAVIQLTQSDNPEVRIAALQSMAIFGTASDVKLLIQHASAARGPEKEAALAGLRGLEGEDVNQKLFKLLKNGKPEVQVECIRIIEERGLVSALDQIMDLSAHEDKKVRKAAIKATGKLGGADQINDLVRVIDTAEKSTDRKNAENALKSICRREGEKSAPLIFNNLENASEKVQLALIGTLNLIGGEAAYRILEKACEDSNAAIQDEAIRTLANWPDLMALDKLWNIAKSAEKLSHHVLAFRGYIRLERTKSDQEHDPTRRLRDAVRMARRIEEKKLALSAFRSFSTLNSLQLVTQFMYHPKLAEEAADVVIFIASRLRAPQFSTEVRIAVLEAVKYTDSPYTKVEALAVAERRGFLDELQDKSQPEIKRNHIILMAGPNDHTSGGAHHYIKDCYLLKACLESSPSLKDVSVSIYINQLPPIDVLKKAKTVVVQGSADRSPHEVHPLFPVFAKDVYPDSLLQYLNEFDQLMQQGLGLFVAHYTTWVDNETARDYLADWIGGYYLVKHSRVKQDLTQKGTTGVGTATLAKSSHPTLRGVQSTWTADEEFYYNIHFDKTDKKWTPLIKSMLPLNDPRETTVAWAVERKGGGRGIGFTGMHFHQSLWMDSYRKFVLNAIVWSAGLKVPKGGVVSELPEGWN